MNDYITLFLESNLALGTPEAFEGSILLGLCRLLPIIAQCPFFGSRTLTNPGKVILGLTFWALLLPTILTHMSGPLQFNRLMILYAFKEVFIGYSIGFLMSMPFWIAQSVGIIIDHQRGGASLMVNDPSTQNQASPLGTLFNLVLIYVFYVIDGHVYFLDAINTSYEIVPPDRFLSTAFFGPNIPFWKIELKLLNTFMTMAVQLAAPGLICILMTDMFLGIANRLAPQVQITFLGMPLKSLLALMVVWLGLKAYNEQTIITVFYWIDQLTQGILSMKV